MPITNGTIEYSRRVKTGDYEHKEAKASISWSTPDTDHQTTATQAASTAVSHVHAVLGLPPVLLPAPATPTTVASPPATATPTTVASPHATASSPTTNPSAEPSAATPAKPRGRPPKTEIATPAANTAAPVAPVGEPEFDPTAPPMADEAGLAEAMAEPAPEPISDKQLNETIVALKAKNAKVSNIMIVTELKKFAPTVGQIPQAKRPAFVAALEALATNVK